MSPPLPEIPERLTKAIIFLRGQENGAAWMQALPHRAQAYARRWGLELLEIAEGGAMSCCIFCITAEGAEAVLKIPFDANSGRLESRSLKRWARTGGSPDVKRTSSRSGVYLMERVRPGTTASPTGLPSDSQRFCDLITRMTRDELGSMRRLETIETGVRTRFDWARERFRVPGYEPEMARFSAAEQLLANLTETTRRTHVLHGDLQSKNILVSTAETWQAIDPLTCRGDLNAEAALWAVVQEDDSTIEERVLQLSECRLLDEDRLRAWCFVYGIVEYRGYMETAAKRIRAFTSALTWRTLRQW
jgi:streptomycin 6-kinase